MPRCGDRREPLVTDQAHIQQPLRFRIDDVECFRAEDIDDRAEQDRADPRNNPRSEVEADSPLTCRHGALARLGLKLPTMPRVAPPAARNPQALSWPSPEQRLADRGDIPAMARVGGSGQAQHRALVVADMQDVVHHPLDHVDGLGRRHLGHCYLPSSTNASLDPHEP